MNARSGSDAPSPDRARFDTPAQLVDMLSSAVDVSRETLQRLEHYEALLRKWQPIKNLVANASLSEIWHRHIADSAQILQHADPATPWLDMGAGAGFPGMVLAILAHDTGAPPPILIEANARKCAFLREVARSTDIAVDIHTARVEQLGKSQHFKSRVVTARALAPLTKLLDYAAPFFEPARPGPQAIFLKGREAEREIASAQQAWPDLAFETRASVTSHEGQLVIVAFKDPPPDRG